MGIENAWLSQSVAPLQSKGLARLVELQPFLRSIHEIFLAGCRGEVAKPGEALQLLGERTRGSDAGKIEIGERDRDAAGVEPAAEQGLAALAIARDMIARNRDQLQRLPVMPEPGEEGTAGELANDVLLGGRVGFAHPSPRSARMFSA